MNSRKILFYGTWEFDGILKNLSTKKIKELIQYAKKIGINKFDTALAYGNGEVERLLSSLLDDNDTILTKIPATTKPTLDEINFESYYPKGYINEKFNLSCKNLNRKKINIVLFNPVDIRLIDEAPERRRKLLNISIGSLYKEYLIILANYQKILTRSNPKKYKNN